MRQKAKRNNQSRVQDAKQMTKQALRTTPVPAHRGYGSAEKQTNIFDDSSGKIKQNMICINRIVVLEIAP